MIRKIFSFLDLFLHRKNSPSRNGAITLPICTGRHISKPGIAHLSSTLVLSPIETALNSDYLAVKWSHSSARNMSQRDGRWKVLPLTIHPFSMPVVLLLHPQPSLILHPSKPLHPYPTQLPALPERRLRSPWLFHANNLTSSYQQITPIG